MGNKSAKASAKSSGSEPFGIIICGPPAAGKGTQCEFIKDKYGVVHLSTGDMLRAAVKSGTEVGKKAEAIMAAGDLVPDDIMIKVIGERLDQDDVKTSGFLLDGFPRTPAQAEALKDMGVKIDVCLFLEVPDEVLLERVTGRRLDPETGDIYHLTFKPPPEDIVHRLQHRADDNEETAKNRIDKYRKNAQYLKEAFSKETHEVKGDETADTVWNSINVHLKSKRS
mmetsp:Transcript_11718/g.13322  ORF Transcript_11718/g.13322 Transcript_11718/m.13322 type:complete len:225 (+) Transcript_11718:119-793(+)|eukprot:CAMPEP_0204832060 /NCGR_PEP_ID=MMETSP1346-20131115/12581_1 /ASSEMBLY_ACC=CAM_ASM_000771 /TAXON_ID=215587 /ORGANISM="Aplanochytrium stocchinoi, Strain GSBS06" /LENGTH=224 /DNA_ID=CAMNT_0051963625 /DNA_START=84 /DNA_END=758 /DNA_ORIENTATION=-